MPRSYQRPASASRAVARSGWDSMPVTLPSPTRMIDAARISIGRPLGGAATGHADDREHAAALGVERVGAEANVVDHALEGVHVAPGPLGTLVAVGLGGHRRRHDQQEVIGDEVDHGLDLSRVESGEQTLHEREVGLLELTISVITIYR